MKHILIAGLMVLIGAASFAIAQQVVPPIANCAMVGAYNSGTQTCTSGQFCRVQVDVNGSLRTAP